MNISLTLNFDTMSELEAYLASRSTASLAAPIPAPLAAAPLVAAPAPLVAVPTPAPIPAPLAAVPAPIPAPLAAVPTPTTAPVDDIAAIKGRIMARLKTIAAGLADQSELGKFITAFGVARFSELPDDRLAQFEQLMTQQYPA